MNKKRNTSPNQLSAVVAALLRSAGRFVDQTPNDRRLTEPPLHQKRCQALPIGKNLKGMPSWYS